VSTFGNYKLQKGVWRRIKIPAFKKTIARCGNRSDVDFTGQKLRIFAPKTNAFIGDQLPVTGTCIQRIRISDDSNWYIFELDQKLVFQNYVQDKVVIRHKKSGQKLDEDKIPIYFMMIESTAILNKESLNTED